MWVWQRAAGKGVLSDEKPIMDVRWENQVRPACDQSTRWSSRMEVDVDGLFFGRNGVDVLCSVVGYAASASGYRSGWRYASTTDFGERVAGVMDSIVLVTLIASLFGMYAVWCQLKRVSRGKWWE